MLQAQPLGKKDCGVAEGARDGKGQHCGGFIDPAPQCEFCLVCKLGKIPDTGGVCTERIAEEGQHCGGFIRNPAVCASGLTCQLGPVPDAGGVCRKIPQVETRSVAAPTALKGEHCGGFKLNAPKCQFGLVCQEGINPDFGGVCTERGSPVGGHCGGNILNPPVCESDLFSLLSNIPDAGGKCVALPNASSASRFPPLDLARELSTQRRFPLK
ncbi:hypothetical protein BDK51DRAFT_32562 [Blyttiomyces helicus]|uniref:Uncharacterized protein n=1 Tax=Blyttiomyces helicus TaxID=388810 RepID=A0A4P9W9G4_9FUNG|nr:hypothetical protein BDK51DRAFT_32562 [Blyttiomyces helicus]|eukprot:RKO88155.1 hypothetical protein BDK51DRAFT_32562 [Blyttiomyces helicus]